MWLVHQAMAKNYIMVGLLLQLVILLGTPIGIAGLQIEAEISSPDGANTTFLGKTGTVLVKGTERPFAEFLGIRYGEPPIGNKRFQKSELYQYESETINATNFGNICYQDRSNNSLITQKDVMNEDCLFLNIYVPLDTNAGSAQVLSDVKEKKAVYIFIHGGVFLRGSSNFYRSTVFTTQGDIIIVTINYRLTYLGFLTTDDDVMPANLGLWDQQIAVQWVNKYIEAFGGDKTRVTVGGQSAGSFSSILQSFYEGNANLFRSTIAESGSPLAKQIVNKNGIPTTLAFAKTAGCESMLSTDIRSCLMNMTAEEIVNLYIDPSRFGPVPIGPTFDNSFISPKTFEFLPQSIDYFKPSHPIPSTFTNKNLLIGSTADDGEIVYSLTLSALSKFFPDPKSTLENPLQPAMFSVTILQMLNANGIKGAKALISALIAHYSPRVNLTDPAAWSQMAVDILTDSVFTVPSINTALIHTNDNAKTFVYEFRLPLSSPLARSSIFSWFQGTPHGADLYMLSDWDVRLSVPGLSDLMITSWSNFIKTGNPNSENSTEWKEFTANSPDVYELSVAPKAMPNAFAKTVEFWNQEVPKVVGAGKGPSDGACQNSVVDLVLIGMSVLTAWWTSRN